MSLKDYVPDMKMTLPRRAAHFLDWAAKNQPMVFTNYNILYKIITGQESTPNSNSNAVKQLRKNLSTTKRILLKEYGREMINPRNSGGVRASVDSGDALIHGTIKKEQGAKRAVERFVESADKLDPAEFPKTKEFAPYKEHFEKSIKPSMKTLGSKEFLDMLTPPKMTPILPPAKK